MFSTRGAVSLALLLVAGCAGAYGERPPETRAPGTRETASGSRPPEDGRTVVGHVDAEGRLHADTLAGTADDTTRVDRETVVTGIVGGAEGGARPAARNPAGSGAPARDEGFMGYRVQVFAAREGPLAEGFADRLRERLPDDPVYVEWEEPWHKVRAGDFTSREEAERLRALLIDMGFVEAWTVRTAIRGR